MAQLATHRSSQSREIAKSLIRTAAASSLWVRTRACVLAIIFPICDVCRQPITGILVATSAGHIKNLRTMASASSAAPAAVDQNLYSRQLGVFGMEA